MPWKLQAVLFQKPADPTVAEGDAPKGSCEPTAAHAPAVGHDTVHGDTCVALGDCTVCVIHALPFQRTIWPPPMAVHACPDVHDTPVSPKVLGAGRIDHATVFQRSTSACPPMLSVYEPTAVQAVVHWHDTLVKELPVEPAGVGARMMNQRVPFQCSASAAVRPELSLELPTATHAHGELHETPARLEVAPEGFGVSTTDHVPAFAAAGSTAQVPTTSAITSSQRLITNRFRSAAWGLA